LADEQKLAKLAHVLDENSKKTEDKIKAI